MYYKFSDSIDKLCLSNRIHKALIKEEIITIKDLYSYPESEFYKIRNLGKKSIDEIFSTIDNIKKIIIDDRNIEEWSNSETKENKDVYYFIGNDGKEYIDELIETLNLSTRAYNCLKNKKIHRLSQLLTLTENDLISMRNMGRKSANEILYCIKDIQLIPNVNGKNRGGITSEMLCQYIISSLLSSINLDVSQVYNDILSVCEEYIAIGNKITTLSQCLENNFILDKLYRINSVRGILKKYIIISLSENIYGNDINVIRKSIPKYFSGLEIIEELITELIDSKEIEFFNEDNYIIKNPKFVDSARQYLTDREYTVCVERISGKTLEEVGDSINVTRERVRQIEAKALRKFNNRIIFKEDIYSEIFTKYYISSEDFKISFKGSDEIYGYLGLRYKNGQGKLEEALNDESIPRCFKSSIEKAIYKNYVMIGDEHILKTRSSLSDYILRTFGKDGISFDDFAELYMSLLSDIGKRNDSKLSLMDRGYENRLAASNKVLWNYGKKFRYYNIDSYDFSELLAELNLNQYSDAEYSTLKFFNTYTELMRDYDIRDEYELHNLLKKICSKEKYPLLDFKRMPNIEFGVANRDNQVMELLLSLAPISNNDFAQEYESVYGVRANTILANYMKNFEKYFYNGVYKIDFPALSDIMDKKLRKILVADFYSIVTIKSIYDKEFTGADKKLLNPYTMRRLGFKVYSNYVIRDTFNSATEYFNCILTSSDIIDVRLFPKELKEIIAYTAQLYKLKAEYEIIEFMPNKYVNIRRLEEHGITKDMLKTYCRDIVSFVNNGEYFTINSIKASGFYHVLDDLGFENWFYTSILVENRNEISYLRIGGNKILTKGKKNFSFVDFLEELIYVEDTLSIDIYELQEILLSKYNLKVNMFRILEAIKGSSMFYDTVSEKIYADYDIYYEVI